MAEREQGWQVSCRVVSISHENTFGVSDTAIFTREIAVTSLSSVHSSIEQQRGVIYEGLCSKRRGKVTGSFPPGEALPNSTSPKALPSSLPRNQPWTTAEASSIQGISTGLPEMFTITARGLTFRTASTSRSWAPGSLKEVSIKI